MIYFRVNKPEYFIEGSPDAGIDLLLPMPDFGRFLNSLALPQNDIISLKDFSFTRSSMAMHRVNHN